LYLDSLAAIIASRVALGALEAVLMTVSTTMIGDYFAGVERDRQIALQTTVASVAAVLLSLIGGLLAGVGWRAPYVMFSFSLLLAPLLSMVLWEPPSRATMTVAEQVADSQSFRPIALAWRCVLAFILGFEFLIVGAHFAFLHIAIGVQSAALIGLAYALNSAGAIVGTLVYGWRLASGWSLAACLASGAVLSGGALALMPYGKTYAALTAMGMLCGVGMGVLFPAMASWNMRTLPISKRGFGTGAFNSSLFLGMFISPVAIVGLEQLMDGQRVHAVGVSGCFLLLTGMAAFGLARSRYARR
jgi:MFS family permease